MRILIATGAGCFLPGLPSHAISHVIEAQIRGLQSEGHEVAVLAPATSVVPCELIPICERPVSLLEDPQLRLTHAIDMAILDKIGGLCGSFDICQSHGLDIPGGYHSSRRLESARATCVTTVHSCPEMENIDYFMHARGPFVAVSHSQSRLMNRQSLAGVIHCGLDPQQFPVNDGRRGSYLCFLGRITPVKRPHLAMKLAIRARIPIRVAGGVATPEDEAYWQRYCVPLLSSKYVEYVGEADFSTKCKLLAGAACNVHPTGFREPFGLTVVEAGYCGTPTLAIRRGALNETVTDGVTGVLVEDMAEALVRLEECLALDRARVARTVRDRFNFIKMAKKYVELYAQLATSGSSRSAHHPRSTADFQNAMTNLS